MQSTRANPPYGVFWSDYFADHPVDLSLILKPCYHQEWDIVKAMLDNGFSLFWFDAKSNYSLATTLAKEGLEGALSILIEYADQHHGNTGIILSQAIFGARLGGHSALIIKLKKLANLDAKDITHQECLADCVLGDFKSVESIIEHERSIKKGENFWEHLYDSSCFLSFSRHLGYSKFMLDIFRIVLDTTDNAPHTTSELAKALHQILVGKSELSLPSLIQYCRCGGSNKIIDKIYDVEFNRLVFSAACEANEIEFIRSVRSDISNFQSYSNLLGSIFNTAARGHLGVIIELIDHAMSRIPRSDDSIEDLRNAIVNAALFACKSEHFAVARYLIKMSEQFNKNFRAFAKRDNQLFDDDKNVTPFILRDIVEVWSDKQLIKMFKLIGDREACFKLASLFDACANKPRNCLGMLRNLYGLEQLSEHGFEFACLHPEVLRYGFIISSFDVMPLDIKRMLMIRYVCDAPLSSCDTSVILRLPRNSLSFCMFSPACKSELVQCKRSVITLIDEFIRVNKLFPRCVQLRAAIHKANLTEEIFELVNKEYEIERSASDGNWLQNSIKFIRNEINLNAYLTLLNNCLTHIRVNLTFTGGNFSYK